MKLKQLLEQLKYIWKRFCFISPMIMGPLLISNNLDYLKENGLIEEFVIIVSILTILSMYFLGKRLTK